MERKIYIWGTSPRATKFIDKYMPIDLICGFIDNNKSGGKYLDRPIFSPSEMAERIYDVIFVVSGYSQEIYEQSCKVGLDTSKMIFMYRNYNCIALNKNVDLILKYLGKKGLEAVQNQSYLINGVDCPYELFWEREKCVSNLRNRDYVRLQTFALIAKEIEDRKLQGAVAEVGVYKGQFAKYINMAFKNKKCYLFDTFEGFDSNEAELEVEKGYATEEFVRVFGDTAVQNVLSEMKYREKVIICKGYFPDSLEGLEEKFCFVSIDVDFERSIFECMKYFYPRLETGGYIFVHDYNSSLLGVREAIRKYEIENNIILCKIPIPDEEGTLIITK